MGDVVGGGFVEDVRHHCVAEEAGYEGEGKVGGGCDGGEGGGMGEGDGFGDAVAHYGVKADVVVVLLG